jgi:uncharacterized protein with FMN-binding domain
MKIVIRCLLVTAFIGWMAASGSVTDTTQQEMYVPKEDKRPEVKKNPIPFKDGIYTGVSEGWTGMEMQVMIQQGQITGIKVLKINGTPDFYQKVLDLLPERIISKGGLDVDGISGATLSSNSMKEAVGHALEKAKNNE